MKSSGIGGQAVLEGVMMKNKSHYAVAVRKPDGEIAIEKGESHSIAEKHKFLGIPVVRGVVNFVESLVLGMRMLTSSAAYFEETEGTPGKLELWLQKHFGEKADNIIMGATVFFSVVMAVVIFMLLPLAVVSLIDEEIISYEWKTLIEGLLRVAIFLGYIVLISQLKDIRRVFMYHGAEHKTINCIEHGMAPTVSNVRKCSRLHKRCGTSFLLFVMLISVVFFLLFRVETLWLRFVVRILFVPVIAGISYEFIRLAGSNDSKLVNVLSKPGLWLQGLTTREPDDDMIRVAVASVEAVFDWEAYLEENFKKKNRKKNGKKASAAKETKKPEEAPVPEKALNEEKAPNGEKTSVDIAERFDWSFAPTKKQEPDEETAKESRNRLAAKVSAADKAEEAGKSSLAETAAALQRSNEEEEEEDEILRALDKYFVFEGEKTVMERGDNKER